MPKVDPDTLRQVRRALERYEQEVRTARQTGRLTESTESTYLRHAKAFVRWLDDDFDPGGGRP